MEDSVPTVFINGWTKRAVLEHVSINFTGCAVQQFPRHKKKPRYKTKSGRKCAVGLFIPDAEYSIDMEQTANVLILLENFPQLNKYMPLGNHRMRKFQTIHDSSSESDCLIRMLNYINSLT